ncbi:hypothetical protein COY96_01200 [Candidatus Wolfebacteria bacterium CG_4_10_14_0_8_um_filter_37_11]|uniref:GIY-YIG domain-containing protein n=1 Tax=Candidatus Wolfebacteria bacterium CG_4_10_14_0_8_um_filter_37_11 TaxID=1975062 RepID=A0A2M7Q7X8_9BACT|nr:MAG: hypothetical protein COY96_01200 [Candidatus Wolfebacteria bacterium CG_4_10_14_0_8_um_filter_37_11]
MKMNPTHNLQYVYLLQSLKNKSLYIGCTSDLKKRLAEHNNKKSYHTSKYTPWKLIYCEIYINKDDAYNREKLLKLHAQGLRRLKERLHNTFAL